jgi:hypothetical protein
MSWQSLQEMQPASIQTLLMGAFTWVISILGFSRQGKRTQRGARLPQAGTGSFLRRAGRTPSGFVGHYRPATAIRPAFTALLCFGLMCLQGGGLLMALGSLWLLADVPLLTAARSPPRQAELPFEG